MSARDGVIGVLHFGLGEIGRAIAVAVAERTNMKSVGAVDVNPELVGRTLGEVAGGSQNGLRVARSLDAALEGSDGARVAFHAAGSRIEDTEPQYLELMRAGLNIVTTAEELIAPWSGAGTACAERLDEAARGYGVTLFPAGVNPGFLMDRLPVFVSSMSLQTHGIHVRRLVDLSQRRGALRRKMGVGESVAEVEQRIAERRIGHVGLVESLRYIADGLGWEVGDVSECLSPVVADGLVERDGERVEAGQVLGLEHTARAVERGGKPLSLSLTMRLDAERGMDEIEIEGEPPLKVAVEGGLNGDRATVASVINAAAFVVDAEPGLLWRLPSPSAS